MHQRKYFTSNFFINEIFSVEKFPNYGSFNVVSTNSSDAHRYEHAYSPNDDRKNQPNNYFSTLLMP